MMFNNLRNAVNAFYDLQSVEFERDLLTLTNKRLLESWYYRQYITNGAFERVKTLDPSAVVDLKTRENMMKKYNRENERKRAEKMRLLYEVENAADVNTVDISVEWKRSRTWGYNPTACVYAGMCYSTGHASGCGYDKHSACIACAFDDNPAVLRILYKHAENGGVFPYGISVYAGLPSFDRGVGVSCFYNIFSACGFTFRTVASGELYNAHTIEREVK